jgi:hypothetical protein
VEVKFFVIYHPIFWILMDSIFDFFWIFKDSLELFALNSTPRLSGQYSDPCIWEKSLRY